jgi:hypothetical protein
MQIYFYEECRVLTWSSIIVKQIRRFIKGVPLGLFGYEENIIKYKNDKNKNSEVKKEMTQEETRKVEVQEEVKKEEVKAKTPIKRRDLQTAQKTVAKVLYDMGGVGRISHIFKKVSEIDPNLESGWWNTYTDLCALRKRNLVTVEVARIKSVWRLTDEGKKFVEAEFGIKPEAKPKEEVVKPVEAKPAEAKPTPTPKPPKAPKAKPAPRTVEKIAEEKKEEKTEEIPTETVEDLFA